MEFKLNCKYLNENLFKDLPQNFLIGHYHSWILKNLPNFLVVSAVDYENNVMAFKHKDLNIYGIQFHPESILTENGQQILKNGLIVKKTIISISLKM